LPCAFLSAGGVIVYLYGGEQEQGRLGDPDMSEANKQVALQFLHAMSEGDAAGQAA
jgi:hypothetical protein